MRAPHPIYTLLLQDRQVSAECRASARSSTAAPGRRAASSAHLRAILDDTGRPMVLINWNTDMGDGLEWSNAEEYPGYIKWTARGLPDDDQRDRLRADALTHAASDWRDRRGPARRHQGRQRHAIGRRTVARTKTWRRRSRQGASGSSHELRQGHRRAGRGRRSGADRALHRRPLPAHRRARAGQDAAHQDARRASSISTSSASSSRPT